MLCHAGLKSAWQSTRPRLPHASKEKAARFPELPFMALKQASAVLATAGRASEHQPFLQATIALQALTASANAYLFNGPLRRCQIWLS